MESRVVVPILLRANVVVFSKGNRDDKYESSHDIVIILKRFGEVITSGSECNYTTSYV